MNGENVVSAAPTSAARRPTVRTPSRYTSGIAAAPAISEGARSSSGVRPGRVVSHARTKNSGGVISASVWTTETTSASPWPATMKRVDSSSANRDCCATASRSATPTAVSATTISMGAHPTHRGCQAAAREDHR